MTTSTQAPATVPGTSVPGAKGHTDGAWAPIQTRSERARSYDPADFELPTGREVNWKHTPIDRIAPLLEDAAGTTGAVSFAISGADAVEVGPKRVGDSPRGEVFTPEDRPAAIAWQQATEATHLRIPADIELVEPVVVDITGNGADGRSARAHAHLIIEAAPNARGVVLLRHRGEAHFAENVEIIVRDGAHLTVITVQEWSDASVHAASHQARVDRDATLRHIVVSFGGGLVRINPSVELAGPGSQGQLYGLSYSDSGQHLESQVYLFHKGRDTRGDVLYKGALQGAGARSVWIGDVLIGPDAVGTDSYEANRNLVLTDGARAESIPNLEIETGDIRGAGHASATGRFDDEQLFYLQSRGISEQEARRLVVIGFLSDIVQRIGIPALETELHAAIELELQEGAPE
ncbi:MULTISPECIES: Fe-S cluster assembly protein SufD [unclassified Microbacterium]|uniref:Fe-S cluster assembly protein SufD n=1 Tax=unclassified Microbacterium TaxID=2609290 RepID=UPI00214C0CED|nr:MULTISPECIES: Fe-S cluster assembly protein SufD [unclassified Microbacterium]MCR2809851.1 Fe-S cluster assembly protein SufD [Microbacterium sp. zg.B185]WIM17840.1 Fe-S cluster assembly protein SufD [Microbacterium sp. zg-B185]